MMGMKRLIVIAALYAVLTALLIPLCITALWKKETTTPATTPEESLEGDLVEAIQTEDLIVTLPELSAFESYIVGVVAAEMPALFPMEALKAQAVAARTYAVRKMEETGSTAVPYDIGQAYIDEAKRKERFGAHFQEYEKRMTDAVFETKDEIMVYEDEPILAVFHAQSSGQTETAENIWSSPLPYLKSVDSSVDEKAPNFETETTISCQRVAQLLKNDQNPSLTGDSVADSIKILSRSPAGYVTGVDVAGRQMTGRQVREALGLRSANFTYRQEGENIVFTTKGYGHGAGMSQYGAKFMADNGSSYRDILNHYYAGIQFKKWTEKAFVAE